MLVTKRVTPPMIQRASEKKTKANERSKHLVVRPSVSASRLSARTCYYAIIPDSVWKYYSFNPNRVCLHAMEAVGGLQMYKTCNNICCMRISHLANISDNE